MSKQNNLLWIRLAANSKHELEEKYKLLVDKLKQGINFKDISSFNSMQKSNYSYSKISTNFESLKDKILIEPPVAKSNKNKIAFLFTGQGAQLPYMGYELYETQPIFKKHFDKCAEILVPTLKRDIREIIFTENPSELNNTGFTQPALFVYEYATAKFWQHLGIDPNWVIGHSVGEYPAATFANYISLRDGVNLISKRAELMQSLPAGGSMAALQATRDDVTPFLSKYPKIEIAALNAPLQTVISGEKNSVADLLQDLKTNKIRGRELVVSHAFHSYLMDPILSEFEEYASGITTHEPTASLISNVTGQQISAIELTSDYWQTHIREKVNFLAGLEALEKSGANCFLEVGPQPFLTGMAAKTYTNDYSLLASRTNKTSEIDQVISTALALEEKGNIISWDKLNLPETCFV